VFGGCLLGKTAPNDRAPAPSTMPSRVAAIQPNGRMLDAAPQHRRPRLGSCRRGVQEKYRNGGYRRAHSKSTRWPPAFHPCCRCHHDNVLGRDGMRWATSFPARQSFRRTESVCTRSIELITIDDSVGRAGASLCTTRTLGVGSL
jgi:hypothetical protein